MPEPSDVTLVIPGRNCESTLRRCLDSVIPLLQQGELREIIFVNDGSTDDTAEIAAEYPITVLKGEGRGPGHARNLGWRAASSELIWFIDSDCVAEPDALQKLRPHLQNADVAGVGGSYANLFPDSLLATLIHEEIVTRHRRMSEDVNFLATFNVLYRRQILQETGGFDETLKLAQDAELAYRICRAGYRLKFEIRSRVGHHHPRRLRGYLRTQRRQGYYRVMLYRKHLGRIRGDSYAGIGDYLQPPLALIAVPALSLVAFPATRWIAFLPALILFLISTPVAWDMSREAGLRMTTYVPFAAVRSFFRGIGLLQGLAAALRHRGNRPPQFLKPEQKLLAVGEETRT
ncbi:glycosyltransferase [Rubinisphaera margarita]|uniref:glycosyltransferase n=1 Tax=Rubinisphaera margarita TaxID=2909586 RepID=UPI001EE7BF6C|nr:glycosyltransferase [Rubinisphaera margarita]MCG6154848.1 glycosyltransferase [Rubinisphaera margarita]